MNQSILNRLNEQVEIWNKSSAKTMLVLRKRSVEFSEIIGELTKDNGFYYLNAGKEISKQLMDGTDISDLSSILQHSICTNGKSVSVLDNAEIFFDKNVNLNAISFFSNLSKFGDLIVFLDARLKDGYLVYGNSSSYGIKRYGDLKDMYIVDLQGEE